MERRVEAVIFAAGEPVEIIKIAKALDTEEKTVKTSIEAIRERYLKQESPLDLLILEGSVQMCTLPQYAGDIRAALALRRAVPLSRAALEVLATIAYNQPVTRSFVDQVRGVDCSSIVRSLAEKGLIEEAGRLQIPGRPIAYRTTALFLRSFGLDGLGQLPPLPEPEAAPAEGSPLEGRTDILDFD
jgi:segregation and condensation protein B